MYRARTRDIDVAVEPYYLEEQSNPEESRYVWGYRIVIENHSALTVQARASLLAHYRPERHRR